MTNSKRIVVDLQSRIVELSTKLESVSPKAAVLLLDLGTAVAGSPSEADWAHADLYRVLNPERIASSYESQVASVGWVRWFEFLRNVLVILPLAVTWIGISVAVRGYQVLLEEQPEQAAQSFIYLWQSGFDGRVWLTLERLAAIDGAILLVVFILSLILAFYSATRQNRGRSEAMRVQYDLEEILADADLVLSVSRQPNEYQALQRVVKMADQVLQSLRQESVRFDKFIFERRNELARLTDFTQTLEESNTQISHSLDQLTAMNNRSADSISQLLPIMERFAIQSEQYVPTMRETNEQLEQLINVRMDTLIASQMQTIFDLQQHMEAQTAKLEAVSDGLPDLVEGIKEFRQNMTTSLELLTSQLQQGKSQSEGLTPQQDALHNGEDDRGHDVGQLSYAQ
ncbi:MAG: hypothetical protein AAF702_05645 [Chloroflexota bacterium]